MSPQLYHRLDEIFFIHFKFIAVDAADIATTDADAHIHPDEVITKHNHFSISHHSFQWSIYTPYRTFESIE